MEVLDLQLTFSYYLTRYWGPSSLILNVVNKCQWLVFNLNFYFIFAKMCKIKIGLVPDFNSKFNNNCLKKSMNRRAFKKNDELVYNRYSMNSKLNCVNKF